MRIFLSLAFAFFRSILFVALFDHPLFSGIYAIKALPAALHPPSPLQIIEAHFFRLMLIGHPL
jgi:hypothetical protein